MTEILFNGTGSSAGVPQLFCTCPVCLSEKPENKRTRFSITVIEKNTILLVDIPFEIRIQLLKSGISNIDGVWLTHAHSDHIAGIDDIRMVSFKNQNSVPVFGNKTTIESLKLKFPYMFFENEYSEKPFLKPVIIDGNPFQFKDIEIVPLTNFHGKTEVASFRIKDFGLLADISTISQVELDKLKGVKVLVVCTTVKKNHERHMSLNEVICLINKISPEKSYLTHMNHTFDYFETLNQLPKGIYPAYDGLRIKI